MLEAKYGKVKYLRLTPKFSHLKLPMKLVLSLPRLPLQKVEREATPQDLPLHPSQMSVSGLEELPLELPLSPLTIAEA